MWVSGWAVGGTDGATPVWVGGQWVGLREGQHLCGWVERQWVRLLKGQHLKGQLWYGWVGRQLVGR